MSSEKILVFTKNWFGDVIMQTPCFRILKENFPGSKLIAAMPARTQSVVKNNPFVDGVIPFDEKDADRGFIAKLGFSQRLRKEKFTRAYLLHRSKTRAMLCWMAGIPIRVGYDVKGRKAFLSKSVRVPAEPMHQTDYAVHLLKASGLHVPAEYFSEFYFSDQDAMRAEKWLEEFFPAGTKKVIALNPGANWEPKRWPAEYFARTADLLAGDDPVGFIITGADKDGPLAEKIIRSVHKAKPVSLCGKTTMGELGALLSHCDLMITADSGPMHIASSVGTPVCALFGPTESSDTGPRGKSPLLIMEERMDGKADPQALMRAITPEKVVKAVRELNRV